MPVPELDARVFIIPGGSVKNGQERLIVLNRVGQSVIEEVRGMHPEFVFVYRGKPIAKMNNTAWQQARVRVGLAQVGCVRYCVLPET